ncbi:hypothetical protein GUITHDRAFT_139332 [Guillardia theta CCMP2712]|uniref:Uncharacterized protein n=1 Tax=Guillardia theta (strain CCMP2712) TaxID=905079 RepID=L1J9P8_GUITC|nr:hypothetical protein GUITHDRAFT_139332 [Guillardia theta CCMP2712]EKX45062.1 hypothetical protein GUITHDRAFT_139332 [Guillardia theta CCMP2712]|eukprot:XP_005832042.1 hypothetical protein GUITHDRAFT_139332 [Guillardia theta CCMP2712]
MAEEKKEQGGMPELKLPDISMPEFNMPEIKMPTDFNEGSAQLVEILKPVEQLSPIKFGQMHTVIKDMNKEAGDAIANYVVFVQIIFLLLFVAYFVMGVIAVCVDFAAMDAPCAAQSWVWLYVLLVVIIPTSLGFIMFAVEAVLKSIDLKKNVGWEVPSVFFSFPSPIVYIVFGILGIVLWSNMGDECDKFYSTNHGMLLTMFHIQVIVMGVAAILGVITVWSQAVQFITSFFTKTEESVKSA